MPAPDDFSRAPEKPLFAMLDSLGIQTTTYTHARVFTVAESETVKVDMPGGQAALRGGAVARRDRLDAHLDGRLAPHARVVPRAEPDDGGDRVAICGALVNSFDARLVARELLKADGAGELDGLLVVGEVHARCAGLIRPACLHPEGWSGRGRASEVLLDRAGSRCVARSAQGAVHHIHAVERRGPLGPNAEGHRMGIVDSFDGGKAERAAADIRLHGRRFRGALGIER